MCSSQTGNAQSVIPQEFLGKAVLEIQDFSLQKTWPSLAEELSRGSRIELISYCPNQDLVIVAYDSRLYDDALKVAAAIERAGFISYLKTGINEEQAMAQCSLGFLKVPVKQEERK